MKLRSTSALALLTIGLGVAGMAYSVTKAPDRRTVLNLHNPGCIVKGPDGKPLSLAGKPGATIVIPRGTTFNGACLVNASK